MERCGQSSRGRLTNTQKIRRDHPEANEFLGRQTQDALDQSHSKLIAAAPAGHKD